MKMRDIRNIVTGIVVGVTLTATTAVSFAGTDNIKALFNRDLKFVVDGQSVTSSSPALTANNSTYLQLRDVANMLNYNVEYDGKTKTITLNDKDAPAPASTASATTPKSDTDTSNKADETDELLTKTYAPRKLPITINKSRGDGEGEISFTLKSITAEDDKVYINYNISNPSGRRFQLRGQNSFADVGLPTQKIIGVGYSIYSISKVYHDTEEADYSMVYSRESLKGVKNLRLFVELHYYSNEPYTFNVDTTGLFD